ncbi:cytochrome P450 [Auricularia subglabra TFB-10046 SS5]|nr:cytochrome P450 [Auricularia subglabra TFB-10046 SS5]
MRTVLLLLAPFSLIALRWIWKTFIAFHPLDNIPGPKSPSFWTGHMGTIFSLAKSRDFQLDIVDRFGRVVLLKGAFGARQLYIADPLALHTVSVKEQDIFEVQASQIAGRKLLLGEGLLAQLGRQHRKQRKIISPVFSVKHLRELVPAFSDIAETLCQKIKEEVRSGAEEVNMVMWLSKAAMELIGIGGMGYSFHALEDGDPEYITAFNQLSFALSGLIFFRKSLPYLRRLGMLRLQGVIGRALPFASTRKLANALDAMVTLEIFSTYERAEAGDIEAKLADAVSENNIMRVLIKANQALDPAEKMSEEEVQGQINTLVSAANVTSSRALSMILYNLSQNADLQDRVRDEVAEATVAHGGKLSFDQLEALPILDAVVRETLRRFPPLAQVARTCLKDTILPLAHPIAGRDGSTISEISVPAGTDIYMSMIATNNDFDTWGPDAREWKPERWLSKLPTSVTDARVPGVYSHQMTFIAGSRSCIGFKFALVEIKVVLSALLAHFRFSPGSHRIDWVSAGIYQPIINDEKTPCMPLKVTLLSNREEKEAALAN